MGEELDYSNVEVPLELTPEKVLKVLQLIMKGAAM
jgi:hypothetical protein